MVTPCSSRNVRVKASHPTMWNVRPYRGTGVPTRRSAVPSSDPSALATLHGCSKCTLCWEQHTSENGSQLAHPGFGPLQQAGHDALHDSTACNGETSACNF